MGVRKLAFKENRNALPVSLEIAVRKKCMHFYRKLVEFGKMDVVSPDKKNLAFARYRVLAEKVVELNGGSPASA